MVKIKVRNETKKDRFKRLAAERTQKVIERIRVLSHCSNPSLYEYSQDDVRKMFCVIDKELKITKSKFTKPQKEQFNF